MARAADVIACAAAELGCREDPPGSNRTKYGAWYGLDGQPWCMMFVQWVFRKASAEDLLPLKTASCGVLRGAAQRAGLWVTGDYRPGDIVIFDFPGGARTDHCGIVTSVSSNYVHTIEGNTSASDDSNGGTVMRRTRGLSQVLGAVRPRYEEEDSMDVEKLTDAQLIRLAERMQKALESRPISTALAEELEEAKAAGITDGAAPNRFCTRAQAAVMVARGMKKD